jgi:N-methylhydantoinase A
VGGRGRAQWFRPARFARTLNGARGTAGGGYTLGVDVGGTFTDAALAGGGRLFTAKVPTTPADQSEGVIAAVDEVLARAGLEAGAVSRFAHGMTVATNGLLEERGARTALVTTAGFADVLEIGRQARPELYRPCARGPSPLVPAELRFEVDERVEPEGVTRPLEAGAVEALVERVEEAKPESVAVCLLHSYVDAGHEQKIASALGERFPDMHVSASHEVLSVFREYERTSTTVIDAYLSPLLARYLERLAARAAKHGLPPPETMSSGGGLVDADIAAAHAALTVLSGPAAGAVGAAITGALAGAEHVLSFDMGGTSTDVSVVDGGRVRQATGQAIAGRVLQLPMVDVHTVGAGGGSIGWSDPGGALRAGPQSAGADPGPACYGRGGTLPTVTDANLLLGYLGTEGSLAGGVTLDFEAAARAVEGLARELGLERSEAAWGIVRVADQEMTRALRVVTVERGIDPRGYALVAFGGAGPMHAARLAEELDVRRVICPRGAGVLSAVGLVVSGARRDLARSVLLGEAELRAGEGAEAVSELADRARNELPGARLEASFDLRYRGQAFELTVPGPLDAPAALLRARFEEAHEERYGYADRQAEIELVNVRVAALVDSRAPELGAAPSGAVERTTREARFASGVLGTAVIRGEPPPGERIEGPAIVELPETTAVVPPEWVAERDTSGALTMEREG